MTTRTSRPYTTPRDAIDSSSPAPEHWKRLMNPEHEERARENFHSQGLMRSFGVTMSVLRRGGCQLRLEFDDRLTQQHGFFHGGVVATLADVSGGYAAFTMLPPEQTNVTVEFKLSLLARAKGDQLLAEATVLKPGRTLTVCRGDVFGIAVNGSRTHCATSLATYMAIDRP